MILINEIKFSKITNNIQIFGESEEKKIKDMVDDLNKLWYTDCADTQAGLQIPWVADDGQRVIILFQKRFA